MMSLSASAGFISAMAILTSHGRALPSITLAKTWRSLLVEPPAAPPMASHTPWMSLSAEAGPARAGRGQTEADATGDIAILPGQAGEQAGAAGGLGLRPCLGDSFTLALHWRVSSASSAAGRAWGRAGWSA